MVETTHFAESFHRTSSVVPSHRRCHGRAAARRHLPVTVHGLVGVERLDVGDHQSQRQAIREEFVQRILDVLPL